MMAKSVKKRGGKKRGRRRVGSSKAFRRINENAAGIDIGSREHYVAVPDDRDEQPVRKFGCCTPDLHDMARWLKECRIDTVAMESTGVYWIPAYQVLMNYEIEVFLVDARHAKNVPGRKSDVQDCQWLRDLHIHGLVSSAFLPDNKTRTLRSYWRQRADLVGECARQIHLMQKALEQMNLQLHKVLSDVTGMSGMKIIRSIVSGENDPEVLAPLCHWRVKASHEDVVKALTGDYREEHLFALKQAVEIYDIYQSKIFDCDQRIAEYVQNNYKSKVEAAELDEFKNGRSSTKRKRRKNQPHFDLATDLFRMTGVDLTAIDGIDAMTAFTVITECGIDMSAFPTEKDFASWLGLCPNNRVTGGKVKSSRTRKVPHRAAAALRLAAQNLRRSKSALGAFHRRMLARHDAPKAIVATAHKLARIIYRMLSYRKFVLRKRVLPRRTAVNTSKLWHQPRELSRSFTVSCRPVFTFMMEGR